MKKKLIFSICLSLVCLFSLGAANVCAAYSPEVTARSGLLLSADTGEVLFESNADQKRPIASMVKIMTLLLSFESIDSGKIKLDDMVAVSDRAASMGGSQAFLDAGEKYKADDLLKSIVIASANDSCVAMAEHLCGSVESFVEQMNEKADSLGMKSTVFVNCTGLPAAGQFSTAKDVSKMFSELIKHKNYFEYTKIWMTDFVHNDGRVTGLTNTNKLIRQYGGCDAGKTGYTSEAGHCIAATAMKNDMRLISVIMGGNDSKSRFADAKKLFDLGFANYQAKKFLKAGEIVKDEAAVSGGKKDTVKAMAQKDLTVFGKKGELKGELFVQLAEVKAPVKKGDVIGKAVVKHGGKILAQTDLVAAENVDKANYLDWFSDIIDRW